jgi:hypothetical protein
MRIGIVCRIGHASESPPAHRIGCRAQILDHVRDQKIAGFVSLAGDRHAFYAGWLAPSLPPKPYAPVGLEFVTGSVSAPGLAEALDHSMTSDKPVGRHLPPATESCPRLPSPRSLASLERGRGAPSTARCDTGRPAAQRLKGARPIQAATPISASPLLWNALNGQSAPLAPLPWFSASQPDPCPGRHALSSQGFRFSDDCFSWAFSNLKDRQVNGLRLQMM